MIFRRDEEREKKERDHFLIKQKPESHQTWQHRKFSTYSSNGFDVYALPNWCWQRKTTLTVCNNHKKYEPKCKMCGLPYYGFSLFWICNGNKKKCHRRNYVHHMETVIMVRMCAKAYLHVAVRMLPSWLYTLAFPFGFLSLHEM